MRDRHRRGTIDDQSHRPIGTVFNHQDHRLVEIDGAAWRQSDSFRGRDSGIRAATNSQFRPVNSGKIRPPNRQHYRSACAGDDKQVNRTAVAGRVEKANSRTDGFLKREAGLAPGTEEGTLTSAEGLGRAHRRERVPSRGRSIRGAFGPHADSSVGGVRIKPHPDAGHPLPMPGGDASDGDRHRRRWHRPSPIRPRWKRSQ